MPKFPFNPNPQAQNMPTMFGASNTSPAQNNSGGGFFSALSQIPSRIGQGIDAVRAARGFNTPQFSNPQQSPQVPAQSPQFNMGGQSSPPPPVALGIANTQAQGMANTKPMVSGNYNPADISDGLSKTSGSLPMNNPNASFNANTNSALPSTSQQQSPQVGGKNPQDIFSQFSQNPQTQQYLQSQMDLITRMAALQGQIAQTNVPSSQEIQQQNLSNQSQLNLANLNPQQLLKDNPKWLNAGGTMGGLQREVAQEQIPIQQMLSQAIISKSALANVRTNEAAALGAQQTGLGAQEQALQQMRQITQFGGLPPEMANAIIQKQLGLAYPQYQATHDIANRPIAFNPYNPSQTVPIGSGLLGSGQGGQGAQGGQGGGQFDQNIQGSLTTDMHGQNFFVESRIPDQYKQIAKAQAGAAGVPIFNDNQASAMGSLDTAEQNLQRMGTIAQANLGSGLIGGSITAIKNTADSKTGFKGNPELAKLVSFKEEAIKQIQSLASGGSGLRINQEVIAQAVSNMPTVTDSKEVAAAKIAQVTQFLDTQRDNLYNIGGLRGGRTSEQGAQQGNAQKGMVQTKAGAISTDW